MGFKTTPVIKMNFNSNARIFKLTVEFLILAYFILASKECRSEETNSCVSRETCAKCIQEDPTCVWCSQEDYTERKISRCDLMENLLKMGCDGLVNPTNFYGNIKNEKISNINQIRPQEIRIKLRPNTPETFTLRFRQSPNYPVDLYYLMDLSFTMNRHKKILADLGVTLANEMKDLTSDFFIGFGSYVDKFAAPFTNTEPEWLAESCKYCSKPYSFQTHMALSSSVQDFGPRVRNAKISGNIDTPEGTLDAMMQAIVCTKRIGWREKSRKLLVVVTDAPFHLAGDGKMGGIIKPNDGECHLDDKGSYNESMKQDYPSLSEMKEKIKEHNINVIFAVPSHLEGLYKNLSERLHACSTGELAEDSTKMVNLIRDQYKAISSVVEMIDDAQGSDNIEVSYSSSCLGNVPAKRSVCKNVSPGTRIEYDVTVKFSTCPKDPTEWNKVISIHPVGLNEKLKVNLMMICNCDCKTGNDDRVKFCSGKGEYECGVCRCDSGRWGRKCECGLKGNSTNNDVGGCKVRDEDTICSDRGQCRCGQCECGKINNSEERYYGRYCECSSFNCDKINDQMCSGHGKCDCGACKCDKGWKGADCGCTDSVKNCVAESGGAVCSGKGTCDCGSCTCEETYYGKFCDDCMTCTGKCKEYGICAECSLLKTKELRGRTDCEPCENETITIHLVDKVKAGEHEREKVCSVKDTKDCGIVFKYVIDESDRTVIYVEAEKKCPAPVNVAAIVLGTVAAVVIGGVVLLLMWKLFTYFHDSREYAKFQKDLDNAKWQTGDNPIFVEPSSSFQNPVFGSD